MMQQNMGSSFLVCHVPNIRASICVKTKTCQSLANHMRAAHSQACPTEHQLGHMEI